MTENDEEGERRWSALLDEARRLIDENDTAAARAVLEEVVDHTESTWGADDAHLIRPLRLLALSYWREHGPLDPRNQREVDYLRRALAIARLRYPHDHLEIGRLAGLLGDHLVIAGNADEGCALMLECLEVARANSTEETFSEYLSGLGHARMAQARPAEALPFLERAVLLQVDSDPSSSIHAMTRFDVGKCLAALGRNQEALHQLHVALELLDAKRARRANAGLMNAIMEAIDKLEAANDPE